MVEDLNKQIDEYLAGEEFEGCADLVKLGRKAVPRLTEIVANDADPARRKRAAIALGRMRALEGVSALTKVLSDKDPTVAVSAIQALEAMRQKGVTKDIVACLKASDPSVRRSAAKALGRLGAKDATCALADLCEHDEFEFVRNAGIEALAQIDRS